MVYLPVGLVFGLHQRHERFFDLRVGEGKEFRVVGHDKGTVR